jgi:hypothetical protein
MSALEGLRNHLWMSMALPLALGCGSKRGSDDEAAVTTDPSDSQTSVDEDDMGDESESSGSTGTSTSSGTESSESSDSSSSETGPDLCEMTFLGFGEVGLAGYPECELPPTDPDGCVNAFYLACTMAIGDQSCEQQCPEGVCGECQGETADRIGACGPYENAGMCCSLVAFADGCGGGIEGRPFVVESIARVAVLERLGGGREATREPVGARLAAHWARVARAEHASVASFAQFCMQLLALGAPAELVRDALAAAGDEVRHARAALALASELAGESLAFGVLDVRGAAASAELEALVIACVREGCIGETLSALELATAAEGCQDPQLAALLQAIADDETRHAALAWRFVQWALARRPSLRGPVAELFADLQAGVYVDEGLTREQRERLRAGGCLPALDRRRVEREGIRELIQPCAAGLLGAGERPANPSSISHGATRSQHPGSVVIGRAGEPKMISGAGAERSPAHAC